MSLANPLNIPSFCFTQNGLWCISFFSLCAELAFKKTGVTPYAMIFSSSSSLLDLHHLHLLHPPPPPFGSHSTTSFSSMLTLRQLCAVLLTVCIPLLLVFATSGIMTNRKWPVTSWEPCGSSRSPSSRLATGTWYHTRTVGKACVCLQGLWWVPSLFAQWNT